MARVSQLHRFQRYVSENGMAGAWVRASRVLRQGGLRELAGKVMALWEVSQHRPVPGEPHLDRRDYARWIARYDTPTGPREAQLRTILSRLKAHPTISIVMPTYNPRREWLIEAIDSVRAQVYPHWQLCIADDASPEPHVGEVLRHYEALDPRIRVTFRAQNGHISAASNTALELASGEWIALLDHDDVLAPDALLEVALAIARNPDARLIYSDEDKLGPRGRADPYFKSDWNPDLFLSQNMFSHLGVLKAGLVREVGGFRVGLEGSQDYDLVLRCAERVTREQVVHIPKVLYHWRVHAESTAGTEEAKPYAQEAALRAVREHLERSGKAVEAVCRTRVGQRVLYAHPSPRPKVGVLLPGTASDQTESLRKSVDRIKRSRPGAVVFKATQGSGLALLEREGVSVVLMLREAIQPLDDEWLDELVRQACRPEVGVVAPMLIGAGRKIASGGVVLVPQGPGTFRGLDANHGLPLARVGHGGRAQLVQEWSAVRNLCIAMRLEVLRSLGADAPWISTDGGLRLCRAVRQKGLRVLWTPFSRVRIAADALDRHPLGTIDLPGWRDPFYNPNLFIGEADFSLAWPPLREPVE